MKKITYICDKCGEELREIDITRIVAGNYPDTEFVYHLCGDCCCKVLAYINGS